MSDNTDELIGDEDASRALVVQATERAIAESLAIVPESLAEGAAPGPRDAPVSFVGEADSGIPAAPADDATPGFHQDNAPMTARFDAIPAFTSTLETMMTTTEDFMAFSQANIEALVKSSQIWAAGVQDLGKHMAASAQAQLDQTMSTWKALASVKSVKEALDVQTGLARSTIESAVSETSKLTDASVKLSEQAFAPITARLSVTAEKFGRIAA